ncbi:glycosyltransferase [Vibrio penaeicida]|uniref:Glycosyltransferase family 2 protein n=1 Tax=Vibrio penaeicida TaxID=104609 RepID=A0AAV5NZE8_9VIBR|nr:glycosyltransferase family 2 protein [Vibrio penaeicida]RTZ21691.1 glycosyltransferase family 2 protein [Vibrio penaeicida]GLQ75922.1 hypothetical protein GCM10007932_52850 [Vibrio penaeicida]
MMENIVNFLLVPLYINVFFLIAMIPWLLIVKRKNDNIISKKHVSVVIPTYNDGQNLIKTLDCIESLNTVHKVSVLIVDDSSTDGTSYNVENWVGDGQRRFDYSYIKTPENTGLKSKAISYAEPHIKDEHDAILIIDGDTILDRHALDTAMAKLYADESIGAVCGAVLPLNRKENSLVNRLQYFELCGAFHGIKLAQSNINSTGSLAGAFTIHKREAMVDVGWFDEWLVEDICWTWKARSKGWQLIYSPESIAYTDCPNTLNKLWMQRTRWSRGRVEALRVAYNEKKFQFLSVVPWFIYSIVQAIWVPAFILALFANPVLSLSVYGVFLLLHWVYAFVNISRNNLNKPIKVESFLSAIWTSFIVDFVLTVPNIKGFLLEVMGSRKQWLTR